MWLLCRSRSFPQWGLKRTSWITAVSSRYRSIQMAASSVESPQDGLVRFDVLSERSEVEHRLGTLQFKGRKNIQTPHYVAIGSRGTVPHITQDLMQEKTSISAMYTAFEDFAEKKRISMLSFPSNADESPLRRFIALQDETLLILGPRRLPPVAASAFNSATYVNVFTSVGFLKMDIATYIDAVTRARPDIVVGIADIEFGKPRPGSKRIDKMDERTLAWTRGLQKELSSQHQASGNHLTSLWAPILPVESYLQRSYKEYLEEQPPSSFGGMALYDNDGLSIIPSNLRALPRLLMNNPKTPHDILTTVSLGADLLTAPFITSTSDDGQAFAFTFPPSEHLSRVSLAVDLCSSEHATSLEPLVSGCPCYTCNNHHRAYIHHLLQAKEMLAWVLLQLHNHAVFDAFFAGIRKSLAAGTFDRDVERFGRAYQSEFPAAQGERPRVRGFQMASAGPGEEPRNKKRYGKLEQVKKKARMTDEGTEKLEESLAVGNVASIATPEMIGLDSMFEEAATPHPEHDK